MRVGRASLDAVRATPLGPPLVVCVGEALFDLMANDPRAAFDDAAQWVPFPGGAPANLAAGLAKLGTPSAIVGAVGDDVEGESLVRVLRDAGVNVDGVQIVRGKRTRSVFVRKDAEGDRHFASFSAANDSFADACELDQRALPGLLFYAAQFLALGTLGLAFPGSRNSVMELTQLARTSQLRIIVDVNWRPIFWDGQASEDEARDLIVDFLRSSADIVKISFDEVVFLFGPDLGARALQSPMEVLNTIGGSCKGVIVTDGSRGAAYAFSSGMEPIEGREDAFAPPGGPVVDTTGAGDAFLAGFLSEMFARGGPFSLLNAEKSQRIAQFAAAAASFVVQGEGAMTPQPKREQVEAILNKVKV